MTTDARTVDEAFYEAGTVGLLIRAAERRGREFARQLDRDNPYNQWMYAK